MLNTLFTTLPTQLVRAQQRLLSGHKTPEFSHDWDQLLCVVGGAARVQNNFGSWTIPSGCAIWIPSGARHSVEPLPSARLRTLYMRRTRRRVVRRSCAVLQVTLLLRALIEHICAVEVLRDDARARRIAVVLRDQIDEQRELPLFVPALRLPLPQRTAAALQADPADTPRLRDLALELGVSERTIERAFLGDASMTIREWRQRFRISRAIELLAVGGEVKYVALEAGYSTPSAFIAAFKTFVGTTPNKIGSKKTSQPSLVAAASAATYRS